MIFILGSSGMLGDTVSRYLTQQGILVKKITREQFDFYNSEKEIIKYLDTLIFREGDLVINCIGVIKPQIAKLGIPQTIFINSVLPHILADYCEQYDMNLIHATTDCVYSGLKGQYTVNDLHDDQDIYGKSKSLGEPSNATCIRVSIIGEEKESGRSLIEWVKSQRDQIVSGYTNSYWNGITVLCWAQLVDHIIKTNGFWKGVQHFNSSRIVTKAELVQIVSDVYGLNITVNKVEAPVFCDRTLISTIDYPSTDIKTQLEELKDFNL